MQPLIAKFDPTGALCTEVDPELFFPPVEGAGWMVLEAKKICAKCPISKDCLVASLENKEEFGIWGGATPNERKKIKTRRQVDLHLAELVRKHSSDKSSDKSSDN